MVLTPSELEKKIQTENEESSKAIEKKIDNALLNSYDLNRAAVIDYDLLFRGVKSYTVDFVLDKYRQAGWKVNVISDQRDGSYVEFSKQKQTYNTRD